MYRTELNWTGVKQKSQFSFVLPGGGCDYYIFLIFKMTTVVRPLGIINDNKTINSCSA